MNENAIVEELYEAVENHGLMNTICAVFGRGAQVELGYTQKLCDTEVKDLEGLSVRSYNALMRAVVNEMEKIAFELLDRGANPNTKDKDGHTIFRNVICKYVNSIIMDLEQEQLYYSNVISLFLSNKSLQLTEQDKRKIIGDIYRIMDQNPKRKLRKESCLQ